MNPSLHDMTDDLLVKFLLGETRPEENIQVQQWMAADAANEKYFTQFKWLWEKSRELEAVSKVDENEAWQNFKQRVERNKKQPPVVVPLRKRFYWMRIAAVLLVIAGACWIALTVYDSRNVTNASVKIESKKNVLTDTLADGSVITLNKNSSLSYPGKFGGKQREIELKGEAFFNVAPDKHKPFIIHVNDVVVKVVGTSFNIKSTSGITEVIVETGIVQVSRKNKMVELKPDEKLTIQAADGSFVKEKTTAKLYRYFRTKEFVCDNTPLWRVVEVLNEAYEAHIVIGRKELKNMPLTTTFNNESLETILDIIAQTFSATLEKKDGQVIIK